MTYLTFLSGIPASNDHAKPSLFSLTRRRALAALLGAPLAVRADTAGAQTPPASRQDDATYRIRHTLNVTDVPSSAHRVRVWFWLPQEDDAQKVLDFTLAQTPPGFRTVVDPLTGHTCLYGEVTRPTGAPLRVVNEFTLCRRAVSIALDPHQAGPLTERHRITFADELRTDVPHMVVDASLRQLADRLCGSETNVVRQARLLYDYVVDHTQHYSKSPTAPKSSNEGDADYCLLNGGGACTDLHALFCAMARARGLPTRFCFGSLLKEKNAGQDVDPGYRCWVLFFAPGYGWVPADMAAANLATDKKDFYFGGLDARRVLFSRGRDLVLPGPGDHGPHVNLFIRAYVEVDGQPHPSFSRTLNFLSLPDGPAVLPGGADRQTV